MASLARTLNKTPSYLSPRLRPSMPGRTFSNSSELSLASNDSRPAPDSGDAISSAPGTPLLSPLDGPRMRRTLPHRDEPPIFIATGAGIGRLAHTTTHAQHIPSSSPHRFISLPRQHGRAAFAMDPAAPHHPPRPPCSGHPQNVTYQVANPPPLSPDYPQDSPALKPQRSFTSKPIAIELPNARKKGDSVYTPTEVLSARGDLPGGYFPLHEDPKTRIHRTHPFQNEAYDKRRENITVTMRERASSNDTVSPASSSHTPISSYLPSGIHDHPLPVGKYYPSNYEKRGQNLKKQRNFVSETETSYSKPDVHGANYGGGADARQRLQQYQRDMVAQATMALGGSFKGNARNSPGLPIADLRITGASPRKPVSPQLVPMGSPGPVTPMDLESSSGYMEKGKGASQLSKENLAPPTNEFAPHSL